MTWQRPNAHFSNEIDSHAGWTIFEAPDYFDEGYTSFFGVHDDTGQVRLARVSGYPHVVNDLRMPAALRKLADLGFPNANAPLSFDEIDHMHASSVLVDADCLQKVKALVGGRVWNSLDLGLPLDDLDAERIREANALLQGMGANREVSA